MVFELVANALSEGLAGYCSRIEVMLAANGAATVSEMGAVYPSIFIIERVCRRPSSR